MTAASPYIAETGRDMTNYFAQVATNYGPLANPYVSYEELLDGLLATPDLQIPPLHELSEALKAPRDDARRLIGVRHDIDADPVTGLRMARSLAQRGIGGSFYLLHSAIYYGEFHGATFVRNPQMIEWIRGFIVAGCEIGVHNDALGVELRQPGAGVAAFTTELGWLRSQGAVIRGSVAHNSAPSHGAENYEIFAERVLWPRESELPLGALQESDLALTYEGTFAASKSQFVQSAAEAFCANRADANIRNETWMRQYLLNNPCCDWKTDYQIWLVGSDAWVIAGRFNGDEIWKWRVTLDETLDFVRELPAGARGTIVLHPEYFR